MYQKTLLAIAVLPCIFAAQTTLYFPGFDPQPLSVDFLSKDSQGNTVWAVHGTTDSAGDGGFPGVATLVEGPNYASFGFSNQQLSLTLNEVCGITGNTAICTITANGEVDTTTDTAVVALTADVGTGPASAISTPAAPSVTPTASVTSVPGSTVSPPQPTASTTSSSTMAASSPTSSNSAARMMGSASGIAILLALILSSCC
ncbi:hypothetical protein AX17_004187 [Amanita inopinata Kibby_2008]|nr:hypothetical protein AX17_004187 [Amanita inopinata Kibby_2008]